MNVQESFAEHKAQLFICSTPIGNLDDVSLRLLEVLRTVDIVAAEDTRHTRKLLSRYDIHPPHIVSYHEHNRLVRRKDLESWWHEGKSVALVSDAGTPGVSDPGEDAVGLAISLGVPVVPVPGPSAVLGALVGSGLPLQPFTFLGFLPRDSRQQQEVLKSVGFCPGVLIFYEAPHRLARTIKVLSSRFPDRDVVLAKELTKRHETFIRGTWPEVLEYVEDNDARGEYVILLGPRPHGDHEGVSKTEEQSDKWDISLRLVAEKMASGLPHTEAVRQVALQTKVRRKDLYNATLKDKTGEPPGEK